MMIVFRIDAGINNFTVQGAKDPDTRQQLHPDMVYQTQDKHRAAVTSPAKAALKLLQVMFETNPLDKSCDQRVDVASQPLTIVYDAVSMGCMGRLDGVGYVFVCAESCQHSEVSVRG